MKWAPAMAAWIAATRRQCPPTLRLDLRMVQQQWPDMFSEVYEAAFALHAYSQRAALRQRR